MVEELLISPPKRFFFFKEDIRTNPDGQPHGLGLQQETKRCIWSGSYWLEEPHQTERQWSAKKYNVPLWERCGGRRGSVKSTM